MRVRLIHWSEQEALERVERLEAAGYAVDFDVADGARTLALVRADPPEAVVIDLDRLPSHGRETARAIRVSKTLRHIPLVLVGGPPEKVAAIKRLLPDVEYTSWRGIKGALRRAVSAPPIDPVVPAEHVAGYSGTPLPKKLGIAPGSTVALVDAPGDWEIGELPEGVTVRRVARGEPDVCLWFVLRRADLEKRMAKMAGFAGAKRLWICWPKKASGMQTDVSEPVVRAAGLDAGLVDYKIAAIDQTWSGLLFTERKAR